MKMDISKIKFATGAANSQSPADKKKQLFLRQKELLDTFLAHKAISKSQYDKSFGDLRIKMGMANVS